MDTNRADAINAYLRGLEIRSYEQVIQLFAKDAVVHSPVYGQMKAAAFYKKYFSDTSNVQITLKNIFLSENNSSVAAVHFSLKSDVQGPFDFIDLFEFSPANKIINLKIIKIG